MKGTETDLKSPTVSRSRLTHAELAARLHALGAVRFGSFTLKSGATSPVYLDLRLLASEPELLADVAKLYAGMVETLDADRIAGIPLAGLPIATAVALEMRRPMVYPRMDPKGHGTGRTVEGAYVAGEAIVVIDDVISSGLSKLEAIRPLEEAGLAVRDVVVLVDRETGGAEELEAAGYHLHAVTTLRQIVDSLEQSGAIDSDQAAEVREFIENA